MRGFLLMALLAASSPMAIPGQGAAAGGEAELSIRVSCAARSPAFGEAFEVEVVLAWDAGWRPEPFDEQALAPLVVDLVDVSRTQEGDRLEERRRYRAQALTSGSLRIPGPALAASPVGGGPLRIALAEPLELEVSSLIGPDDPPEPEPPTVLMAVPRGPSLWPWLLAAALVAVVVARGRTRRRVRATAPTPAVPALGGLDLLERGNPRGFVERRAEAFATSALLRRYVDRRFGLAARTRTTRELAADPRLAEQLDDVERRDLLELLAGLDAVKFEHHEHDDEARGRDLARSRSFVEATRQRDGGGEG